MRFAGSEEIDVYAVGWLSTIQRSWRCLTDPRLRDHRGNAWKLLRRQWRYTVRCANEGNWRAVRQGLNGYLAEHPTSGTRCGHGWTKKRALRDLRRHLNEYMGHGDRLTLGR